MKNLYIVDYWVPFPTSEYGGMITLIASNDSEAFELLAEQSEVSGDFDNKYISRIMPNVVKAQKFPLVVEHKSTIIESFTT